MCLGCSVAFVHHFHVCLYWFVFGIPHLQKTNLTFVIGNSRIVGLGRWREVLHLLPRSS